MLSKRISVSCQIPRKTAEHDKGILGTGDCVARYIVHLFIPRPQDW